MNMQHDDRDPSVQTAAALTREDSLARRFVGSLDPRTKSTVEAMIQNFADDDLFRVTVEPGNDPADAHGEPMLIISGHDEPRPLKLMAADPQSALSRVIQHSADGHTTTYYRSEDDVAQPS